MTTSDESLDKKVDESVSKTETSKNLHDEYVEEKDHHYKRINHPASEFGILKNL